VLWIIRAGSDKTSLMKLMFSALAIALACFNAFSSPATTEGKIVSFGIMQRPSAAHTESAPQTPSGVAHIFHEQPTVTTTTNRIQAKLGVGFGIIYELSNSQITDEESVDFEVVTSFPKMTKPDGSTSTGFSYSPKSPFRDKKHGVWQCIPLIMITNLFLASGVLKSGREAKLFAARNFWWSKNRQLYAHLRISLQQM
jgi:hypothetical protein